MSGLDALLYSKAFDTVGSAIEKGLTVYAAYCEKKIVEEKRKILQEKRKTLQEKNKQFEEQRLQEQRDFDKRLSDQKNASEEEKMVMRQQFNADQTKKFEEWKQESDKNQKKIDAFAESLTEAQKRLADLNEEIQKPIRDRQAKIDHVNSLNIQIRKLNSLALVGEKGMGKSTFLWLLNKGEKPEQSYADGTVKILHVQGFVDLIGLCGWTPEEIAKLFAVFMFEGFPKDLIIFTNDRVTLPTATLGVMAVNNPLIVVMASDFWQKYQSSTKRLKINLVEDENGVKKAETQEDLEMIYNMEAYKDINHFGLGKPVTHHDDIIGIAAEREKSRIQPFEDLLQMLGSTFLVKTENPPIIEKLFRMVYLYDKIYERDTLRFMNKATMQEFV